MCGIAGLISAERSLNKEAICREMVDKIKHRGPDFQGVYCDETLAIGHARLSILDLSEKANQPFWDTEEQVSIVFNGEIYNHLQLRQLLPEVNFQTNSDTETLLYAFKKWGAETLDRLEGMFAFAIYDKQRKELFIARDRLGIKPLYYHAGDRHFVFSSELRSLYASGLIKKEIDPHSALEMIQYQAPFSFKSILKDVELLPPGCFLRVTGNDHILKEYWKPTEGGVYDIKLETSEKKIHDLLFEAVEKRLISDVPLGAFLSGGIDSSAIVAIMSKLSDTAISTFSVTFDEEEFSEKKYSDMIAKMYGTNHNEVKLKADDFLAMVPDAMNAIDQPSADGINTYVVSKHTKEAGLTVALSGLGGDELFLGYPQFCQMENIYEKRWLYSFPLWMRRIFADLYDSKGNLRKQKIADVLRKESFDLKLLYPGFRQVFPPSEMELLSKEGIRDSYPIDLFEEYIENYNIPLQSKLSILELKGYMHSVLLKDADQMSMAHALEVRVPFLDHKLVEFVLRLPDAYKFGPAPKNLLVSSLGNLLPGELVNRPKMGFILPWEHWLKNELRVYAEQGISRLEELEFLNYKRIHQIWESFLSDEGKYSWSRIWPFVVLGHSLNKYD